MKRRTVFSITACALIALCFAACGGLDPGELPPDAAIAGSITYIGGTSSWPDTNVIQVRILAFETQPTTEDEVIGAITSGKVSISDTLRRWVADDTFTFKISTPPREFKYVVVAMQNGPNFLKDWLMIGVYSISNDPLQPSTVAVDVAETEHINFTVDFDNLPPQPIQ